MRAAPKAKPRRAAKSAEAVTDWLREAISNGSYQPNERLVEEDVARRVHSNRATVRLAMARIEQEGLLERERNRGVRVRLVSEDEAVEILEARAALEAIVARHAAANLGPRDAATLRSMMLQLSAHHDTGDILAYADLNAQLHLEITRIAHHGTATKLLGLLKSQIVRFQYQALFQPGRIEHSVAEHRRLIDAIIAKDPDRAEAAMRDHLDNAVVALQRSIRLKRTPA